MNNSDTSRGAADVQFAQAGVGHGDMRRLFPFCHHKGSTTGAQWVRGIGYVRCASCNAARVAAKDACRAAA